MLKAARSWLFASAGLVLAVAIAVDSTASPRHPPRIDTAPAVPTSIPVISGPAITTTAPPPSTTTAVPTTTASTALSLAPSNQTVNASSSPAVNLTTYPGSPPDLTPLAPNPSPGEGHWVPAGRAVDGTWPVWVTTLRPASGGAPSGIARIDTSLVRVVIYAGTTQPPCTWANQGEIPNAGIPKLVAAFNGGFQFGSAGGGFYADGHANPPLVNGAASLVVKADGSAFVAQWGRDATLTPDISEVRQNLSLMVDGGAVTPAVPSSYWGATITHSAVTWRSGVGSDNAHHLFFVGGPNLTPAALAALLIAAGATRAMEYDINPQWVLFASFTNGPGPVPTTVGAKLLPTMNYPPDHFLYPDWREFVAMFIKT